MHTRSIICTDDLQVFLCNFIHQIFHIRTHQLLLQLIHAHYRQEFSPKQQLTLVGLTEFHLFSTGIAWVPRITNPQILFIPLQLSLEAKIRQNSWPRFSNEGNGVLESHFFLLHYIGDDECRALFEVKSTLEIPAAQWTKMLPFWIFFWSIS